MKKKILYMFSAVMLLMLLGGCRKEFVMQFSGEPQLILLATLRSGETEHSVYLAIGSGSGYKLPSASAKLSCYVNGSPAGEFVSQGRPDDSGCFREYKLYAEFKPGDEVRISADSDGMQAYAENVFPETCGLTVDSSSVASPIKGAPECARKYSFTMTVEDIPGKPTNFQALIPEIWVKDGESEYDRYDRIEPVLFYDENDPVFENLMSPISGEMELATSLVFAVSNYSRIFTDRLFEDGEYEFDFIDILDQEKLLRAYGSGTVMQSHVIFTVATLNDEDYEYYKYLNAEQSTSALSEPVVTVSNVVGGMGYVATLGTTSVRMDLKTQDWTHLWE